MGLWQTITGRTTPKAANLDDLFLVPSAALTLQTAAGLTPTGHGSVCYRGASGAGFAQTQTDILDLLRSSPDAPDVEVSLDDYDFTWLQTRRDLGAEGELDGMSGLCTDLHAVNTTLEANGFGPGLLCSLIPFTDAAGRSVGLVYLYKKGTFYAFAPTGPQSRDNLLELTVRDTLAAEIPFEKELASWLALWGAPGL
jgi:hypothetical protein